MNIFRSSEPVSRIAHSMATYYKIEPKFTGKLGDDLTEHINNFMDAASDYTPTNSLGSFRKPSGFLTVSQPPLPWRAPARLEYHIGLTCRNPQTIDTGTCSYPFPQGYCTSHEEFPTSISFLPNSTYSTYSLCRPRPARMAAYLDRPPGIPHWSRRRLRWPPCRYRCRPSTPRLPRPPWRAPIPKRRNFSPRVPRSLSLRYPWGSRRGDQLLPPRRSLWPDSGNWSTNSVRRLTAWPSRSTDCPLLRPS
jgi:hypothetical protein